MLKSYYFFGFHHLPGSRLLIGVGVLRLK